MHMIFFSLEKSSCRVIFRSVYIFPHAFPNEKCTRATSWMFNSTFCAYDVGWKEIEIKPLLSTSHRQTDSKCKVFTQASFGNVNSPTFQQTLRGISVSACGSWGHPLSTRVPLCQLRGCFIWWGPQLSGRWALFSFPKQTSLEVKEGLLTVVRKVSIMNDSLTKCWNTALCN